MHKVNFLICKNISNALLKQKDIVMRKGAVTASFCCLHAKIIKSNISQC